MSQKEKIIEILKGQSPLSQAEIAKKMKTPTPAIYDALKKLVSSNVLFKDETSSPIRFSVASLENWKKELAKSKSKEKIDLLNLDYKKQVVSQDDIAKEGKKVHEDEIYGKEESLIDSIFSDEKYKKNNDKKIVAMKIAIIDVTNSTQLSKYKSQGVSLDKLADLICSIKNFDARVEVGDSSLVSEIANPSKIGVNLFSFASKYCCYSNYFGYGKNDYSIYDSVLINHLPEFIGGITTGQLQKLKELHDYKTYNDLIGKYLETNTLKENGQLARRQFDHYVWNRFNEEDKKNGRKK